jgi:hypothetical protein
MRSLKDANRGGRAVALGLAGALAGTLVFLVVAWPETRRQAECEALAERVAHPMKQLSERLKAEPAEWAAGLERAAGYGREAILADSPDFLRLNLTTGELAQHPEVLVERLRALADTAVAVDGSPDSRRAFEEERGRWIEAMRATTSECAP